MHAVHIHKYVGYTVVIRMYIVTMHFTIIIVTHYIFYITF